MMFRRREFLRIASGVAAGSLVARGANAQNYPTRPLRLILGYPAGGSTDLVARIMGAWLTDRLGQSVVIENKPGHQSRCASGSRLAIRRLHAFICHHHERDQRELPCLAAVRLLARSRGGCRARRAAVRHGGNPSLSAKTVAEFIAYAKANAGKINAAPFGTGTISHMAWTF
jgi:hypothetical protein